MHDALYRPRSKVREKTSNNYGQGMCIDTKCIYNKQQLTAELFSRNILGWVLLLTICNQFKSQITKFDR